MSDAPGVKEEDSGHEGPIKTPKQLVIAVILAFIIPVVVILLLATFVTSGDRPAAGSDGLGEKGVAERTAPVGTVQIKDATEVAAVKTGEQVFTGQCSACHATGAAGAPKFGDQAAWAPRIGQGYDTLLTHALHGKGNMPPQGGGAYSDYEVGRAVVYMANQGGAHFEEPAAPAPGAASGATASADSAPSAPAADPAAMAAAAAQVAQAKAGGAASSGAAGGTVVASAGVGAAPALYTQVCQACHGAGLAGAPKFGDKAAWAPRVAQGVETLTSHAINGKGVMPPRGGSQASDAEIKEVVVYMANAAK